MTTADKTEEKDLKSKERETQSTVLGHHVL